MASIRLADYEVEAGELPQVCIRCGEAADGETRVKFSWHPPWVNILILVGLLPWAIVAMILTKRMTASLPTCQRHRGHWFNRRLFVYGGLLVLLAMGIAGIAILASQPGPGNDDLMGVLCGSLAIGGLIWLVAAMIYSATGIRPSEITDRDLTLVKVSPEFIDAVCEDRIEHDEDEILRPNWWMKRRRKRRREEDEDEG